MPYAITAVADGMALRQTRVQHASAIVLARKWIARGFGNVEIVDNGNRYTLDAFQKRFVWAKGGYKDRGNVVQVSSRA